MVVTVQEMVMLVVLMVASQEWNMKEYFMEMKLKHVVKYGVE